MTAMMTAHTGSMLARAQAAQERLNRAQLAAIEARVRCVVFCDVTGVKLDPLTAVLIKTTAGFIVIDGTFYDEKGEAAVRQACRDAGHPVVSLMDARQLV